MTSALSDRLNIARRGTFPQVELSAQALISCNGGGNCDGGNPGAAYEYIYHNGITDTTCAPYAAKNLQCNALAVCETCHSTDNSYTPGVCEPVKRYNKYGLSEYGSISGASNMKKEIYARGPISCGISVTKEFEEYSEGVFSQHVWFPSINHEISIIGWGYDTELGKEYWIGRNSWGTYWGENGFCRIQMYKNNLGIEKSCSWGVPVILSSSHDDPISELTIVQPNYYMK